MVIGKQIKENPALNVKNVLERVSAWQIYRHYLGAFEIGEAIRNEYRGDKNPSLQVKVICGDLHHFDYANDYWRGRCFDLVMQIYGCDMRDALQKINYTFNLGLGDSRVEINRNVVLWEEPKELKQSIPPLITFRDRKFNKRELDYWGKLGVGETDLKKDNIYAPEAIYINYKKHILNPNELCFIYHYPDDTRMYEGGSVAIYRPEADKKHKWFKNVTFTHVEHVDKLEGCQKGFLTKSKKDRLVLKNILGTECICTIQAENISAIGNDTMDTLMKVPERYAILDSDETGKALSWHLTKQYQFKHINTPDPYLPHITDFADMVREFGVDAVKTYFRSKNLIN